MNDETGNSNLTNMREENERKRNTRQGVGGRKRNCNKTDKEKKEVQKKEENEEGRKSL